VTSWTPVGKFQEFTDEWGNTWRRIGSFTKGEVSHGAIEDDWSLLDSYQWPDVTAPQIWEEARRRCAELQRDGYYVLGGVNWPFNVARYMRRLENFFCDLIAEKANVIRLLNAVADVVEREIEGYARVGVDGISTAEDWGTQDRLLVSPAMWREIFKPLFKRLCGEAHRRRLDVWLHSCGHVAEVLDDWVEAGINVCMFDQPELHGIDCLAQRYGGRMAFCSPVDIQRTLQTRDAKRIEAAAKCYIEKLGAKGGGFIADCYGDNESIGLPPEIQQIACRAFTRYGDPRNFLDTPEELR
jgi:uroporphyrinogen-III decarboxylase